MSGEKDYLKLNYSRYPLMQPDDFLKLVYQAEYGCGHLSAAADTLALLDECSSSMSNGASNVALFDEISDTLCRVNLLACKAQNVSMQSLSAVVAKSQKTDGNEESLARRCKHFLSLVEEKYVRLPYYSASIKTAAFLKEPYHGHHSPTYKINYNPHYRVVKTDYAKLLPLISAIDSFCDRNLYCVVALDGCAASGKTTFANLLHEFYPDSCIVSADDFFLPPERKTPQRLAEVGGNIDFERLEDVLRQIKIRHDFVYDKYDCATGRLVPLTYQPKRLTIVEGVYSSRKNLAPYFDLVCRLNVSRQEQLKRLYERDARLFDRFVDEWLPLEKAYFSEPEPQGAIKIDTD